MKFPFLTIFLIFILWLTYRIKKATNSYNQKNEDFWSREKAANATIAKDINNLSYITIPLNKFPLHFSTEKEVCEIEEALVDLSQKRILNLTDKSNTDLKEAYGVPNFDTMVQIGENFEQMTKLLNDYAAILIDNNMINEAICVLEFAVGVRSDISSSYIMLAKCYKQTGSNAKLSYLIDQAKVAPIAFPQNTANEIAKIVSE